MADLDRRIIERLRREHSRSDRTFDQHVFSQLEEQLNDLHEEYETELEAATTRQEKERIRDNYRDSMEELGISYTEGNPTLDRMRDFYNRHRGWVIGVGIAAAVAIGALTTYLATRRPADRIGGYLVTPPAAEKNAADMDIPTGMILTLDGESDVYKMKDLKTWQIKDNSFVYIHPFLDANGNCTRDANEPSYPMKVFGDTPSQTEAELEISKRGLDRFRHIMIDTLDETGPVSAYSGAPYRSAVGTFMAPDGRKYIVTRGNRLSLAEPPHPCPPL